MLNIMNTSNGVRSDECDDSWKLLLDRSNKLSWCLSLTMSPLSRFPTFRQTFVQFSTFMINFPRLFSVWSLLGTDCYLTKISFEISCYFSPRAGRRHQPPAACSGYTFIPLKTLELKIILLTTGKTFNLFQAICRNKYLDIMFQFLIIVSVIRSGDLKTRAMRECTYLLLYTAELSHIKKS